MRSLKNRREVIRNLPAAAGVGAVLSVAAGQQAAEALQVTTYESWIHGHTGRVEVVGDVTEVVPFGFFLRIKARPFSGIHWVHYGIPTVVPSNGRLWLRRVMLKYHTSGPDVIVDHVHVWEGGRRIQVFEGLGRVGNHEEPPDSFDITDTRVLRSGIGVSIGFRVGDVSGSEFRFVAVGGAFSG